MPKVSNHHYEADREQPSIQDTLVAESVNDASYNNRMSKKQQCIGPDPINVPGGAYPTENVGLKQKCTKYRVLLIVILAIILVICGIVGGFVRGSNHNKINVLADSPIASPSELPNLVPSFRPSSNPSKSLESPLIPNANFQSQLISLIQSRSPTTSFDDTTSPQSMALDWMVTQDEFGQSSLLSSNDRLIQRFALVTLWYATGGPTTWDEDGGFGHGWLNRKTAECEWNFLDFDTCSSDGLVTTLALFDDGLSGSLPAELGLLSSLTWLNLFRNQLSGAVPSELGQLTTLQLLDLFNNEQLKGTLPTTLCNNKNIHNRPLRPRIDCENIECECCLGENRIACP